ncbi:FGGY-family carbohydrate kinase [Paracoccus zeaxanthinifaciens]|uniref:FGGY-family carbohydrate kinase n=1 Tax=Paracoccus zeaxanthinifaciens TaxID=187400 RepID=UPI0003B70398|nr:FGGY-family carbohydrate kinase [Paracoccus zeaxanthinifaciens]
MHYIGVDVGTGSARAGVFDAKGALKGTAKRPIDTWRDDEGHAEQSSAQIWKAVCDSVAEAVLAADVSAQDIAGIGFDATCSLVIVGGTPCDPAHPDRDVIAWFDHRAEEQADRINATAHPVLQYVGGRISPEMQTPKLLWLKENRNQAYKSADHFFDLTDFLTWKASGSVARSTCTVTCKWTYLAHEGRWDGSFFDKVGLGDLTDDGHARIGSDIVAPGTAVGHGLTEAAAHSMGLRPGTAVAAGLIDAHAGGLATVGAAGGTGATRTLAYVFGTSSCTMTTSNAAHPVPGVWGPYFSAMVPGLWLNEGGQSAAGAALDQLCSSHPAAPEAARLASEDGKTLTAWLADRAQAKDLGSRAVTMAQGLHVVPEYLGNRAPFADPRRRAVIAGLGLQTGLDSLVALYVAGLCGLAYGLRQIIEAQTRSGLESIVISVSGGAGTHPFSAQILADATGRTVEVTQSPEPVLLGSAMLAAHAAQAVPDLQTAMRMMSSVAHSFQPDAQAAAIHDTRFDAFERLQAVAHAVT